METVTNKPDCNILAQGSPVAILEYRSGGDEQKITWRDKETGESLSANIRRYNCECGSVLVMASLPRDVKPVDTLGLQEPLERGKRYVFSVRSWVFSKGVVAATGLFLSEWPVDAKLSPASSSGKVSSVRPQ